MHLYVLHVCYRIHRHAYRDIVEVRLDLGGVSCIVSDTAGIRNETIDQIEQEGMRRAK